MQGREPTELEVEAWHTVLADVDADVARARAMRHFESESRDLWPADILRPREEDFEPGDEWQAHNR